MFKGYPCPQLTPSCTIIYRQFHLLSPLVLGTLLSLSAHTTFHHLPISTTFYLQRLARFQPRHPVLMETLPAAPEWLCFSPLALMSFSRK